MIASSFPKRIVGAVVVVMFCLASMTGCASLRKKFTRKPKEASKKEDFIPVLQPVEYKKVVETPQKVYRDHYTMVKVYFKSLWDVLGKPDGGAKREKYILVELLARFDAMTALLSGPRNAEAKQIHARLEEVLEQYEKPDALRRYDRIKSIVSRIERDIHKGFKPEAVADAFVTAQAGALSGQ